jgi:RNA polymerase sigma-70 factor (ECF subfamily)
MNESRLVARVADGDEDALAALVDQYQGFLVQYAARRLSPAIQRKVSAADVVQDATMVALRRISEFEGGDDSSFRRWMLRIVGFKAQEAVRRHAGAGKRDVRRELTRGHRGATGQVQGDGASPSQMAMAGELETRAKEAMASLPDQYREVLRMARLRQLTLSEIARHQGRSREAVKKTYARALARFHAALDLRETEDA